jgi:hypothetical protein
MKKKVDISNRLDLLLFFKDMKNYVIIRIDDNFPNYKYSDDIDILTNNLEETKNHILNIGKKYKDFKIKISHGSGGKTHYHIDFYYKNENIDDFRFDLIGNLSHFYKNTNIPKNYIKNILISKSNKHINNVNICIPMLCHELELRYLEYITKIKRKPEKIKHLKFIEQFPNIKFNKYHTILTNE